MSFLADDRCDEGGGRGGGRIAGEGGSRGLVPGGHDEGGALPGHGHGVVGVKAGAVDGRGAGAAEEVVDVVCGGGGGMVVPEGIWVLHGGVGGAVTAAPVAVVHHGARYPNGWCGIQNGMVAELDLKKIKRC